MLLFEPRAPIPSSLLYALLSFSLSPPLCSVLQGCDCLALDGAMMGFDDRGSKVTQWGMIRVVRGYCDFKSPWNFCDSHVIGNC